MSASGDTSPDKNKPGSSSTGKAVVTRFAPSPTGFLHIGGARTAMFNWLVARHFGGKALLRIEDTDKKRSTDEAIAAIFDGLDWLGLDWDGETVFQTRQAERHSQVAHQLLADGKAYKCFATQQELEAMRAQQKAEKKPLRYDGRWRDRDPSEAPAGAPYVIRLKAPRDGKLVINDAVQGEVTVSARETDDFILLRSDGSPTYMLAVVVDDFDMGVTHVIRGDDHLNNAFRQLVLIRAMGWPEPVYAHIPLIHGNDGAKLSKRHGALGVDSYRDEMGILPEAMFNYLLRLGWGYGDRETISREEAIALFSLDNVGKSPSRFDVKKLMHLNASYMKDADDRRLAGLLAPRLTALNCDFDTEKHIKLLIAAMPVLKTRAKNLDELAESAQFLFRNRPIAMDDKAQSLLQGEAIGVLRDIVPALNAVEKWSAPDLEIAINALATSRDEGLGVLAQPLRAALTGQARSPGIFDVLTLLGREESLARLNDQITA